MPGHNRTSCISIRRTKPTAVRLPQLQRSEGLQNNRDYLKETSYDVNSLAELVSSSEGSLTNEQRHTFQYRRRIFDAPGRTSKTFPLNLVLAKVRSNRDIALAVPSSGIAATLLEGGKTALSAFKLPLDLIQTETPLCNIPKQSNMAEVLRKTK